MSVFKNYLKKFFIYSDKISEHDFVLPEYSNNKPEVKQDTIKDISIYDALDKNLEFLKCRYNSMINSDIILREFTVTAKGKQYKALLVAIDGMASSELINNFLLKPLMIDDNTKPEKKGFPLPSSITNKINIKKVDTFDLADYLYNILIPQNSIEKTSDFEDLISSVNRGFLCITCRHYLYCFCH